MTLADNLSTVLDADCSLDINTRSTYQNNINANAGSLDELFLQSKAAEKPVRCAFLTCAAARLVLSTSTIIPGSSTYTSEQKRNCYEIRTTSLSWVKYFFESDLTISGQPIAGSPPCIVKPRNAIDVAITLKIVTTLRATFAVRSAGHNSNPGFSSVGQEKFCWI